MKICDLLKILYFYENICTILQTIFNFDRAFMKQIAVIIFLVLSIIIITIPVFAFNVDVIKNHI